MAQTGKTRMFFRKIVYSLSGEGPTGFKYTKTAFFFVFTLALVLSATNFVNYKNRLATSAAGDIINNTNLSYVGVSVHTKAIGPDGRTATVRKGNGDVVTFELTITNADVNTRESDLKFTLPAGFTYGGITIQGVTCQTNPTTPDGANTIYWRRCQIPPGERKTILRTTAP